MKRNPEDRGCGCIRAGEVGEAWMRRIPDSLGICMVTSVRNGMASGLLGFGEEELKPSTVDLGLTYSLPFEG